MAEEVDEEDDFDFETHWTFEEILHWRETIDVLEEKADDLETINEDDREAKQIRQAADQQTDELLQWLIQVESDEGLNGKLSDAWHEHDQGQILLTILTTEI